MPNEKEWEALRAKDHILHGLDPNKPVYSADNSQDLTLDDFIRSLRSDKRSEPVSVKLAWRAAEWNPLFTVSVTVEVLIESLTQVYPWWYDPEPTEDSPGQRYLSGSPEWAFTGRLIDKEHPFNPTPDAAYIGVRGFLAVEEGLEGFYEVELQIVDDSLTLPTAGPDTSSLPDEPLAP